MSREDGAVPTGRGSRKTVENDPGDASNPWPAYRRLATRYSGPRETSTVSGPAARSHDENRVWKCHTRPCAGADRSVIGVAPGSSAKVPASAPSTRPARNGATGRTIDNGERQPPHGPRDPSIGRTVGAAAGTSTMETPCYPSLERKGSVAVRRPSVRWRRRRDR